jgi:hypothetical protein
MSTKTFLLFALILFEVATVAAQKTAKFLGQSAMPKQVNFCKQQPLKTVLIFPAVPFQIYMDII